LSYRFDNEWRRAVEWSDTLLVNSPDGVVERVFRFRRTHHGPIVAQRDGRALAVRIARMEEGGSLQQLYATGRATGIDEFRAALDQRALAAAAMYADIAGNIVFVPGNAVPVRDTAFDWSRPVDGGSSVTEWHGLHAIAELPQIVNPASGWIHYTAMNAKGVIEGPEAGSRLTFEDLAAAAFDARVADARDAIAQVILEWERAGGDDAARARRLDAPVELLRDWDHVAHIESVAATLFVLWQERLQTGGFTGDLARFRALESVIAQLEGDWGRADVEWGEINRIQRVAADGSEPFSDKLPSLPAAGAPGWLGSTLAISASSEADTRMRYGIGGTSWVHAAELAQEIRSETVVTFVQSADAESPHWFDQARLFTAGRLKPAWFTRPEIMANARRTYRPSEAAVR
jgi:penicillin amidase